MQKKEKNKGKQSIIPQTLLRLEETLNRKILFDRNNIFSRVSKSSLN